MMINGVQSTTIFLNTLRAEAPAAYFIEPHNGTIFAVFLTYPARVDAPRRRHALQPASAASCGAASTSAI